MRRVVHNVPRFFSHIKAALDVPIGHTELRLGNSIIIGSDEEKGMTKALRSAFPAATHILCTKHLNDNLVEYLKSKVGVKQSIRRDICAKVFGKEGLVKANNMYEFEKEAEDIGDHIVNVALSFKEHFRRRLVPVVREFVQQPTRQYSWLASR